MTDAVEQGLDLVREDGMLLVTGSFYVVATGRFLLSARPADS